MSTLATENSKKLDIFFIFLSRGIILWIELPWPENPAKTYAWHAETLDSCFDHSLQSQVSAVQSVVAGSISSDGDHGIHCWWDLIRSKQLSSVSVCHA